MSELINLTESSVLPEHIDGLGHMNVKFYSIIAEQAAHVVLQQLGLDASTLIQTSHVLAFSDVYIRYRNEQLEGAPLAVRGGVLTASKTAFSLYLEIINRSTQEVAATFVQEVQLLEKISRSQCDFPDTSLTQAMQMSVDLPEYAKPRTLSLEPVRTDLTLEKAMSLGLEINANPAPIAEAWCDQDGFLRTDDSHLWFMVAMGLDPTETNDNMQNNNFEDAEGRLVGWAMMETRRCVFHAPKKGDVLHCFQAQTTILEKVHGSTRWIFRKNSGELCAIMQTVALAFDINQRRPMPIPEADRAELMQSYHPELA